MFLNPLLTPFASREQGTKYSPRAHLGLLWVSVNKVEWEPSHSRLGPVFVGRVYWPVAMPICLRVILCLLPATVEVADLRGCDGGILTPNMCRRSWRSGTVGHEVEGTGSLGLCAEEMHHCWEHSRGPVRGREEVFQG